MSTDKIRCDESNASTFCRWFEGRGGLALWRSADLSDPGASCTTPAKTEVGEPFPKPHWKYGSQPAAVVTDPTEVEVYRAREVKRFHVAVRRGGGLKFELTPASSAKLRKAVDQAEIQNNLPAHYVFDYETQEAVICVEEPLGNLLDWARGHRYFGVIKAGDTLQLFANEATAQGLISGWGGTKSQVEADLYGQASRDSSDTRELGGRILAVPAGDRRDLQWTWNLKAEHARHLLNVCYSSEAYRPTAAEQVREKEPLAELKTILSAFLSDKL